MRAYTGVVAPAAPAPAPRPVSIPRGDITGPHRGPSPLARRPSPWLPVVLLGGMALVLIVLLVALLR
jgi:hypothetical protein